MISEYFYDYISLVFYRFLVLFTLKKFLSVLRFTLLHKTVDRCGLWSQFMDMLFQPRTQALSSMRRRGGKTLVGAGHVIDQILIAKGGVGKVSYYRHVRVQ